MNARATNGFTLIEILLVVSILALVVTMGLGHFSVGIEHGRIEGAASELRSLDARARLLAKAEGSVELRMSQSTRDGKIQSQVLVARRADGEILTRSTLPYESSLRWNRWSGPVIGIDPSPLPSVVINRQGESPDIAWTISGGTQRAAWVVLGTTGATVELADTDTSLSMKGAE